MSATLEHGRAIINAPYSVLHGREFESYTAYCLECVDEYGVGWHGSAHMVGLESAPMAEAVIDAELHNEEAHPGTPIFTLDEIRHFERAYAESQNSQEGS